MTIGTKIYTLIRGIQVGSDSYGNKYFVNSKNNSKAKRWVIFKGESEASKVPAHWHAWLHKMTNDPPIDYKHKYKWQKNHKPNMTGTSEAYYPSNHPLSNSYKKNEADYETWEPE